MAAARIVLCIEPDAAAAAALRTVLEPQGFVVEVIPEGDRAIEWGRLNVPVLIVLSVEPRKIGYAICNKLRRSPTLRDVKLILASSEETMETFEQHRRLKSHADAYMLKPYNAADLRAKVEALLGLGDEVTPPPEATALSEDIAIDDVEIEETPPPEPTAEIGMSSMRLPGLTPAPIVDTPKVLDDVLDADAQAAFASMAAEGVGDIAEDEAAREALSPWGAEPATPATDSDLPPVDGGFEPNDVPTAQHEDMRDVIAASRRDPETPEIVAEASAQPMSPLDLAGDTGIVPQALPEPEPFAEPPPEPEPESALEPESAPAPEAAPVMTYEEPPARRRAPTPATAVAVMPVAAETTGRVEPDPRNAELEAEVARLRRENDALLSRTPGPQAFSKEKEFLNLREIINKKEKDILDLRDALDAREKQTLDLKDRVRELERGRRDVDEKALAAEKGLLAAQERLAALAQDKERAVDREKGLKARLEDAQGEIRKAHDEVDALKKRLAGVEERVRAEFEPMRAEIETRLSQSEDAHRQEVARLHDEHAAAEAAREAAQRAEMERLETVAKTELDSRDRRAADEIAGLTERHDIEVGRMRRDHEQALAALREEQAVQLAEARQKHEASAEEARRGHKNELAALRSEHAEALAEAERVKQAELTDAAARQAAALAEAEGRRERDLEASEQAHERRVAEIEERFADERTGLVDRHRAEMEATQARVAALEARVAELAEQVSRASERIRGDEKAAEKAKRALAVALAMLDERNGAAEHNQA